MSDPIDPDRPSGENGPADPGPDDPAVALAGEGLDRAEADAALFALQALGIPAWPLEEPGRGVAIAVPAGEAGRSREVLSELAEERAQAKDVGGRARQGEDARPWLDRSALAVAGLLALLVAAYVATAGFAPSATWEQMLRGGAIEQRRIEHGEAWRLGAAILLHFDVEHLLSNAAILLFLGPLLAREIGGLRLLAVFAGAGIAGNLASFALAPSVGLKAGASGGIAGLLGALAGESLGARRDGSLRFRRWQVLAALAAAYALLVGASPRADHVAHAAGLVAGVAIGRLLHPRAQRGAEVVVRPPGS